MFRKEKLGSVQAKHATAGRRCQDDSEAQVSGLCCGPSLALRMPDATFSPWYIRALSVKPQVISLLHWHRKQTYHGRLQRLSKFKSSLGKKGLSIGLLLCKNKVVSESKYLEVLRENNLKTLLAQKTINYLLPVIPQNRHMLIKSLQTVDNKIDHTDEMIEAKLIERFIFHEGFG